MPLHAYMLVLGQEQGALWSRTSNLQRSQIFVGMGYNFQGE